MSYQSISNPALSDEAPLIRTSAKGTVDVVEEGGFDEINGTRSDSSRRGRRGAALSLLLLAVGAVSAVSLMRGKASGVVTEGEDMVLAAVYKNRARRHWYYFESVVSVTTRICSCVTVTLFEIT